MSVISQFFPSSEGGGSSSKMDLEVLILSGGGGAAITGTTCLDAQKSSGLGGGGAVFVGSVPVSPGSPVTVVVGGGGAGSPTPQPNTTCQNGARGGCSSITTPEGTICVAGGGAGIAGDNCAIGYYCPTNNPPAGHVFNGGTGGTGGHNMLCPAPMCSSSLTFYGPGNHYIVEGGKPYYSPGNFEGCVVADYLCTGQAYLSSKRLHGNNFKGPGQINHKYGTFMGGAAAGGISMQHCCAPCTDCWLNGMASGGAGGHAVLNLDSCSSCYGPGQCWVAQAGPAYCSDITGTLEQYGQGVVHTDPGEPQLLSGGANTGRGGSVSAFNSGCICSGSGGSGVVVIRYPDQFAAAPAAPGATDCSSATPGYRTYRFNSSGAITLP